MPKVASRRRSLLWACVLLAVITGTGAVVALLVQTPDFRTCQGVATPPEPTGSEALPFTAMNSPPFRTPDTLPPPKSDISTDDQVIGVSVGGVHRAYAVKAFAAIDRHVLNDLIAGQPVTVTYCPQTGCTRVFTGQAGRRLQMRLGGWAKMSEGNQMVLRVGRMAYLQGSGRAVAGNGTIPNPTVDHELTTLGEWRKEHPDTDLYSGGGVVGY